MKRRDFMTGAAAVTVTALPVSATRLSTNYGKDGFDTTITRPKPPVEPVKTRVGILQDSLLILAKETVRVLKLRAASNIAFLGRYDGLLVGGEVLHEHNTETKFDVHLVTDTITGALDLTRLSEAQLLTTFAPVINELVVLFDQTSRGKTVKMANLPMPLPGTGAVAEIFSDGSATIRAIGTYDPHSLCLLFSLDMLYGHVEKVQEENSFQGLQTYYEAPELRAKNLAKS